MYLSWRINLSSFFSHDSLWWWCFRVTSTLRLLRAWVLAISRIKRVDVNRKISLTMNDANWSRRRLCFRSACAVFASAQIDCSDSSFSCDSQKMNCISRVCWSSLRCQSDVALWLFRFLQNVMLSFNCCCLFFYLSKNIICLHCLLTWSRCCTSYTHARFSYLFMTFESSKYHNSLYLSSVIMRSLRSFETC